MSPPSAPGLPRRDLFDLAVNRAAEYADRLGLLRPGADAASLHGGLELWYLRTRFAYRVPLDAVIEALRTRPGPDSAWEGGPGGGWREGGPRRP